MARMNSGLILAGQTPDVIGALDRGAYAGQRANTIQQENELRQFIQEQGPAMFSGDVNALRQFAQFDPAGAFNMQSGFDDRAWNTELRDMERQRFGMEQQRFAAEMEPDEADFMAGVVRGALTFYNQGDMEGAAAWLEANGVDPAAVPPEALPALGAQLGIIDPMEVGPQQVEAQTPVAQIMQDYRNGLITKQQAQAQIAGEQPAPPGPQSAIAKLQQDLRNGLISQQEYEIELQRMQPSGTAIAVNPDGTFTINQGPGVTGANMTEGQSKDTVYATRARAALEGLDGEGGNPDALTNWGQRALGAVPADLGRYFQSPDYQVAEAQGQQFLSAILRKDTGAAITREEEIIYGDMFLPRPGDTPEVLAVKRDAREMAVLAIENGMPPQAILAQANALMAGGVDSQPGSPIGDDQPTTPDAPDFSMMSREELLAADISSMNAAEVTAYMDALAASNAALSGGQ